jgi:hypothetical protein
MEQGYNVIIDYMRKLASISYALSSNKDCGCRSNINNRYTFKCKNYLNCSFFIKVKLLSFFSDKGYIYTMHNRFSLYKLFSNLSFV